MDIPQEKVCLHCDLSKPLDEFGAYKRAKDGKRAECNACRHVWYLANKPHIAAHQKERLANRSDEKRKADAEYHADYYEKNRDYLLEKQSKYYEAHREELVPYWAAYYAKTKEISAVRSAAWRKAHPKEKLAHEKRRRARKANAPVNDLSGEQWEEIRLAFNYRCAYCPPDCKDCRYKRHKLTQEHVTPYHHNGSNTLWNVVPACQHHNSKKGRKKAVLQPVQPLLLTLAPAKPLKPKKKAS